MSDMLNPNKMTFLSTGNESPTLSEENLRTRDEEARGHFNSTKPLPYQSEVYPKYQVSDDIGYLDDQRQSRSLDVSSPTYANFSRPDAYAASSIIGDDSSSKRAT